MNKSKSKKGWLILQLVIRKGFYTISWSFILELLKAYNPPSEWISLINSCLSGMDYTPIFNGTKIDSFKPKRGIRQGDPLYPYLFILAMEYLSILISNSINQGNQKTFKIKNQDCKISHLLFADDVLLFAKADPLTISSIKHILDDFHSTSRMEINLDKSKLWLSPYIPENRKSYISHLLQVNNASNLETYLGFPLKPRYSSSEFNYIIHKLCHKLQGWKMHLLSFA